MKLVALVVALSLLVSVSVAAQTPPTTPQISTKWLIYDAASWNEAGAYFVFYYGRWFIAPTGDSERPWVLINKYVGDMSSQPLTLFAVEPFASIQDAANRMTVVGSKARIITAPDGTFLVYYRR